MEAGMAKKKKPTTKEKLSSSEKGTIDGLDNHVTQFYGTIVFFSYLSLHLIYYNTSFREVHQREESEERLQGIGQVPLFSKEAEDGRPFGG